MVDTGHSYSGMCEYYHGKYITYSESKPISMNPFRITEEEYNVEKKNFLKSLIFLIWKGANGEVKKQEEEIMDITIENTILSTFIPLMVIQMRKKKPYVKIYYSNFKSMKKNLKTKGKKKNARYFPKNREITATSRKGEGGEKPTQKKRYKTFSSKKALHAKSLIILKLDYFL